MSNIGPTKTDAWKFFAHAGCAWLFFGMSSLNLCFNQHEGIFSQLHSIATDSFNQVTFSS
jgi:hypothetical protein